MKKYIFIDLDGTLIDSKTHEVPESTINALKLARENGHELILATGRPPALFYGIDKKLGFNSYVAANGRIVVYNNKLIYHNPIPTDSIEKLLKISREEKIDIAFEGEKKFVLASNYDDVYIKFCDFFKLEYPVLNPMYYKTNNVYQITMFYSKSDYKKFNQMVPELSFEYSNPFGLDVNNDGGLKEIGIKEFQKHLMINDNQIVAIGDGYNDISMLKHAHIGIAMGNAYEDVKKAADYITDKVNNDGIYKAFVKLNII